MEFIKNHFYKLTKEIPVKQLFQMPSGFTNAYYGIYGNSIYGSYTISTYDSNGNMTISNVSPYETSKRFTLGRIYQAFSTTVLYDDIGYMYYLDEKHINSGKMAFQFNFLDNNMVGLKMTLNGKHSTWVSLIGVMGQVNEMLHNAYIALRKAYIKKIKTYLEVNYRWSTIMGGGSNYIYDIETNGFLGRL